jgi:hypothetical protein
MARRRPQILDQFIARTVELIRSDAFRTLSLSAHRVLARIEIEHADHGGRENGRLKITFADFEEYGIERHSIAPAIRECEALGFIEIVERGRAGNSEFRKASVYRLTYIHGRTGPDPTNEWKRIRSREQADFLAKAARRSVGKTQRKASRSETAVQEPDSIALAGVNDDRWSLGGHSRIVEPASRK